MRTGSITGFVIIALGFVAHADAAETVAEKAQNDDVVMVAKDDPAMLRAFEKARSSLDEFLARFKKRTKNESSFALKVGVRDGNEVEYFWVAPFAIKTGDRFSGVINNEPRLVSTVRLGQQYEFKRSDIFDWTYYDEVKQKMNGNFTACALLIHEPREQAEEFKRQYGLDCSE